MRIPALLAAAVTATALTFGGAVAAPATAATFQPCTAGTPAGVDFDGDRTPDAAISAPGHGTSEQGLVEIRYGTGRTNPLTAADPGVNDNLGWALQPADLNGDICTDLVVGAPFSSVAGKEASGAVYVFLGKPDGFHQAGVLYPGSAGVPGAPGDFAYFGWALGLDRSVVYIGEPCAHGAGDQVCAGAATRLRLTITENGGVTATGTRITEGSLPIGGVVEPGDGFGSAFASLDGKMAIGAPGDGAGGAVFVVGGTGSASRLTQDTPGIPGAVECCDEFGATLLNHAGNLVVGSPDESIGTAIGAGMITIVPVESGVLRPDHALGYSQNSSGVAGAAEHSDRFGAAVHTWDTELLVGSPGETVGTLQGAGMVAELGTGRGWTQNTAGIPGNAAGDGQFGFSIGSIDGSPLISALGHGGSFRGGVIKLGKESELWTLSSTSSNDHQEYGHAISSPAG